jgi:hypothetical protein
LYAILRCSEAGGANVEVVGSVKLCHSFSNTECREEILTEGTTHVAIGFVDLGTLLHAKLQPATDTNCERPLRWVGYELSAYACAKTMIVNQLFEDQASVDDIMQVCKTKVPLSHDEYCIYD